MIQIERNQIRLYTQTFGEFLKNFKKIVKQAHSDEGDKRTNILSFWKIDSTNTKGTENRERRSQQPGVNKNIIAQEIPLSAGHSTVNPERETIPSDSKASAFIARNKDTPNKVVEADSVMRPMEQRRMIQLIHADHRKPTNPNTIGNWCTKFVTTTEIPGKIVENETQNKQAPHTDKKHTSEMTMKTTKKSYET